MKSIFLSFMRHDTNKINRSVQLLLSKASEVTLIGRFLVHQQVLSLLLVEPLLLEVTGMLLESQQNGLLHQLLPHLDKNGVPHQPPSNGKLAKLHKSKRDFFLHLYWFSLGKLIALMKERSRYDCSFFSVIEEKALSCQRSGLNRYFAAGKRFSM